MKRILCSLTSTLSVLLSKPSLSPLIFKLSKPYPWHPKERWVVLPQNQKRCIIQIPNDWTNNPIFSLTLMWCRSAKTLEKPCCFGRWIDVFKNCSISFVDILDYNLFLFEDFEIISAFIESSPGKLLDPRSVSYPTLVKLFYYNLSFIAKDGFPALRSFVKGQEIVITKTLINELFNFSNVVDDPTPNSIAFQNAKDLFVLPSHLFLSN